MASTEPPMMPSTSDAIAQPFVFAGWEGIGAPVGASTCPVHWRPSQYRRAA